VGWTGLELSAICYAEKVTGDANWGAPHRLERFFPELAATFRHSQSPI